jgi:hypothetical protein
MLDLSEMKKSYVELQPFTTTFMALLTFNTSNYNFKDDRITAITNYLFFAINIVHITSHAIFFIRIAIFNKTQESVF